MISIRRKRLALAVAVVLGTLPWLRAAGPPPEIPRTQDYTGKVIALAPYFEKLNARIDKDAADVWFALVTSDGKMYPLIKDAGGRMFFKDPRLLDRPVQLKARIVGTTPFLQVFQVYSIQQGRLHEVYYWCDICAIKRFENQACDCCNAPMVLREEPVK